MTLSKLKKKLVLQAINVLRDINKNFYGDTSKKKLLLEGEEEGALYLQVNLKKIPKCSTIKMIKVNLPHTLIKDTHEVCLITGDLDKKNRKADIEPDVLHYKELLDKHGVTQITQVVTLRQLRTEYKPYEAKQKLLAAYDLFIADNTISQCLPNVLGRHFFKKRKFPVQINLKTQNLKQQIEKALSTKLFYVAGHGNSCTSEVAYLDMADSEILDNVLAMVAALSEELPGSWDNVMGIYLRSARSKAIPLYMSYDSPNDVQLQEVIDDNEFEIDELSSIPHVKVKVYSNGKVETVPYKDPVSEYDANGTGENDYDSKFQPFEEDIEEFDSKKLKTTKSKCSIKTGKQNDEQKSVLCDNSPDKKSKKRKSTMKLEPLIETEKQNNEQESALHDKSDKNSKKLKVTKSKCTIETKKQNDEQKSVLSNNSSNKSSKKRKSTIKLEQTIRTEKQNDEQESALHDKSDKSKKEKSNEKRKVKIPDTFDHNLAKLQRRGKEIKSNSMESDFNTSHKNKKEKSKEKGGKKNDAVDSDFVPVQGKVKKVKNNCKENGFAASAKNKEEKSETKTEKVVPSSFNTDLAFVQEKRKQIKKVAEENVLSVSAKKNVSENKKTALKRKRIESESTILDSKESETTVQGIKKRKIEGIDEKRNQARKEARKNRKKEPKAK